MALVIKSLPDNAAEWHRVLSAHLPDMDIRIWPDVGDPEEVEVAFMLRPPVSELKRFPNLKALINLNVGVDTVVQDKDLPPGLPLARTLDPGLVDLMANYFVYGALHFHRGFDRFAQNQRERRWNFERAKPNATRTVGVMGLGAIGAQSARLLKSLGFEVCGWSRSRKSIEGVTSFAGPEELDAFLARSEILCCIVPLTPETERMIDADFLRRLPQGAAVINLARGAVLVEADLIAALDAGHIRGAMLDVFETEPLPEAHPLWSHPKVVVTPHVGGNTNPVTAAPQVVENIRRALAGEPLLNPVDPARGY